jgi:hypothetical protein
MFAPVANDRILPDGNPSIAPASRMREVATLPVVPVAHAVTIDE